MLNTLYVQGANQLSQLRLMIFLCLCSGLLVSQAALANHGDTRRSTSTDKGVLAEIAVGAVFGEEERRILRDYLQLKDDADRDYDRDRSDRDHAKKGSGKPKKLPPGLRKKIERGGELPPGWQKKVARGEVLDEHLYNQSHHLPRDVLRHMSEVKGTSLRQIDDRVLRIQDATRTILDIFYLADQL